MSLEYPLSIGVLVAVGCGIAFTDYSNIVFPTIAGTKSNPILAFAAGAGGLLDKGLGIPPVYGTIFGILLVEGFVVTTLDTAVRLNRYLLEELWQVIFKNVPAIMKSYLFNALLCVVLMATILYSLAALLFNTYIPRKNIMLSVVDVLLIIFSIGVIILSYKKWRELRTGVAPAKSTV